jgi:hypothetical protein
MPKTKLTQAGLRSLICPPDRDRQYFWDVSLGGFGVVVFRSGKSSFIIQYKIESARYCRLTIGNPATMTLRKARELARKRLGEARRDKAKADHLDRIVHPTPDEDFYATELGKGPKQGSLSLRLPLKLLERIDKWRKREAHLIPQLSRSRSVAVRLLLQNSLKFDRKSVPGGYTLELRVVPRLKTAEDKKRAVEARAKLKANAELDKITRDFGRRDKGK